MWRLEIRVLGSSKSVYLGKLASLRGQHSSPIVSLAASKAYSIVVSGDASGVAVLWDLNRSKVRPPSSSRSLALDPADLVSSPSTARAAAPESWRVRSGCRYRASSLSSLRDPLHVAVKR